MPDDAPSPEVPLECPHCGQPIGIAPSARDLVLTCSHCRQEFVVPGTEPEDAEEELEYQRPSKDLMASAQYRKAQYRTRSWYVVGSLACGIIAIRLLISVFLLRSKVRGTMPLLGIYLVSSLGLSILCAWLGLQARRQTLQLRVSSLPDPETPPDFSTLSDGKQISRELGRVD